MRQVFWDKSNGKWKASCKVDGKTKYLGSFDDEVEAARAFDTATKDIAYYQREGKVNFPAEQDEEGGEQDAWSSQYFGVRSKLVLCISRQCISDGRRCLACDRLLGTKKVASGERNVKLVEIPNTSVRSTMRSRLPVLSTLQRRTLRITREKAK